MKERGRKERKGEGQKTPPATNQTESNNHDDEIDLDTDTLKLTLITL
jgi:hypothetical protein